ncbi:hypothetical protein [Nocardia bhagyanarayanae]|uniref:Uncharacterized protein n=1 Tax=Nocardia bhagyanarayanae TaxID=1215925 RepID=A0A543FHY7_9NOCA|nr:hypothetical protein [Nocardia bhagyanarayanae]TQM33445.1 hypothetical protein FB390_5175 [Nocardia bhagyanarayanae]
MGSDSRYEAYEVDLWERLAALLPSIEDADSFRDCRESGHQEAGLWMLVQRLLEHQVPVSDRTRAEMEVLAEHWGERLARHDEILSSVRDSADANSIRLLPDDRSTPVDPAQVGITGSALTGLLVVPWIECLRCGRVLARVHAQEPWGDLRYLAAHYVVWHHTASDDEHQIFDEPDLHSAFELLLACR